MKITNRVARQQTVSHHQTELVQRAGGLWEAHCTTCGWRPAVYQHSEHDADLEQISHHERIARGGTQIRNRTIGMAPTIAHARQMAERETTPLTERNEWLRLADEMERNMKTSSRTKAPEVLAGQEVLFGEPITERNPT